jgi:hypothetical protein
MANQRRFSRALARLSSCFLLVSGLAAADPDACAERRQLSVFRVDVGVAGALVEGPRPLAFGAGRRRCERSLNLLRDRGLQRPERQGLLLRGECLRRPPSAQRTDQ